MPEGLFWFGVLRPRKTLDALLLGASRWCGQIAEPKLIE